MRFLAIPAFVLVCLTLLVVNEDAARAGFYENADQALHSLATALK